MMKLCRLIRRRGRYGMDITAEVGPNQGGVLQILPELDDFPVGENPERMAFAVKRPADRASSGRLTQHHKSGAAIMSRGVGDGEFHMGGEFFEILLSCRNTFAFAAPRDERRVRVGKPSDIWIVCGEDRLKVTALNAS